MYYLVSKPVNRYIVIITGTYDILSQEGIKKPEKYGSPLVNVLLTETESPAGGGRAA